jgi:protein-S-isoprenylcysteine O-methyltransferase Ste14
VKKRPPDGAAFLTNLFRNQITRNPIYSGFLFGFVGTAMTVGLLEGYCAIPFVLSGIHMKISIEEKFTLEVFTDQ